LKHFDRVHGKFSRELNLKSFAQVEPRCHPMRKVLIESGINYVEAGAVSLRVHGKGNVGAKPKGEVIVNILASIKERRA
jgi:hypothetical protein